VAALVEVLAVDQCGQSKSDAVAHLLLVAQTDLGGVVDLGPEGGVLVKGVLASNGEAGVVGAGGPGEVNGGIELGADLVVQGATKLSTIISISVEGKVWLGEADSEVVLGELGLGCVEGHLVANQPVLVGGDGSTVDDGAAKVQGGVEINGQSIGLVGGLQDTRLLASLRCKGGIKDNFKALSNLIVEGNLSVEGIVGVPFLSNGKAVLLHCVFGLQVSGHLARLEGVGSPSVDLNTRGSLALAVQLEDAKVVALAEHILGGLA